MSKINGLENQVNYLADSQYQITDNISNQTNNINHILNDFKEEQSWISAITMDINTDELKDEKTKASFQWQVKELHEDAEVIFHYAFGNTETYEDIPAEQAETGIFNVQVPFDLDLEPQWEIMSYGEEQEWIIEEKKIAESRAVELKYYVSVSSNDIVKSSALHRENLGYVGTGQYGIIHVDMDNRKHDETLSVSVTNHRTNPVIRVEEAYLLVYQNEAQVSEEKLESEPEEEEHPNRPRHFHLTEVEQYEDMRVVLKVVYNNGDTFEREIY